MKLTGKAALVTGAARGIGKAIALALAREGCDVVVSDIDEPLAKAVAREIEDMGQKALAVRTDVSKLEDVKALFKKTIEVFGRLDILVNNAGIIRRGSLEDHSDADWELVMAVNLRGTYYCSREAARIMKRQRSGRIINISSVAGKVGDITSAPSYGPSKGAVNALTKSLARELAPFGVTVNAVAPHAIETEMSAEWSEERRRAVISQIPLGRMGKPEEVAAAVVFLASEEAAFITGEILDVNGGYLMD
ncbi:MAG: 3-oxoacyl-[acyl-carrier-protein] reductase [Acetothermia bacterium 64_32]|nr:MAG: 3-oxoacyl-[acyl-carrier-protein] reductase [Acetothermia bacterium 64_32]HAF70567.1 short-chain dehydrogenase [Candidatus Acetothermia bacterium]